jgi:murein DD-endopeptidase MepM/ murein hydrolase activator NlpD
MSGRLALSDKKWPLREVVAPNSTREIARVFAKGNVAPCRVDVSHSESIGDAFATPDARYPYRLPFKKGEKVRVMQEPNGVITTHKDAMLRYAVDFGVRKGTLVLAARAGVVIEVRDGFSVGRPDPALAEKVNFISIIHDDGTFAQYVHLAPGGVLVRPGEKVEESQPVGYSGNTGFSGGPHLHFDLRRAVIRPDGTVTQESLPVSFFCRGTEERIPLRRRMQITVD